VNADIEWKFLRAKLILGYQTSPVIPAPFNLVFEPICWVFGAAFGLTMLSIRDDSDTREHDRLMIAKLQGILIQKLRQKKATAVAVAGQTERSLKALETQITALTELLGDRAGGQAITSATGTAGPDARSRQESFAGFEGNGVGIGFPSSGGSVRSGEQDHDSLVC